MVSAASKPKVVIVGGAAGGQQAYQVLSPHFDVTLVNSNEYFEFTPSALRCIVEPQHADKILTPLHPSTVVGIVERLELAQGASGGFVVLRDNRRLPFDYLLLCTGTSYAPIIKPVPGQGGKGTIAARKKSYQAAHEQLKKASSVLIVGGGTVGVELAAEIVGTFGKQKQVTLISNSTRLLDRLPAEAGSTAYKWLQDNGVKLLLGDRVENLDQALAATADGSSVEVTTKAGRSFQADLIYSCIGGKPNSGLLQGLGLESIGWQLGRPIPVNQSLQVRGLPGFVFAAGDCTDSPEEKTAFAASLSGALAAINIINAAFGKPLLRFPQDICFGKDEVPQMQNVSLHRKNGIMVTKGVVKTGPSSAQMKGMVEWFVMKSARGSRFWGGVWRWMSKSNLKSLCQ